jgi:hypothetical protein
MITTLSSSASFPSASVLGPGMASASAKFAWSSVWQKYCERKSSCRQMIFAPRPAAVRMPAMARARLSAGSVEQRIWTSPTGTFRRGVSFVMAGK